MRVKNMSNVNCRLWPTVPTRVQVKQADAVDLLLEVLPEQEDQDEAQPVSGSVMVPKIEAEDAEQTDALDDFERHLERVIQSEPGPAAPGSPPDTGATIAKPHDQDAGETGATPPPKQDEVSEEMALEAGRRAARDFIEENGNPLSDAMAVVPASTQLPDPPTKTVGEQPQHAALPEPPAEAPESEGNGKPAEAPETEGNGKPAEAPETEGNGKPAEAPETEGNGKPAEAPETEGNDKPAEAPETEGNGKPAEAPETEGNGKPAEAPETEGNGKPPLPPAAKSKRPKAQPKPAAENAAGDSRKRKQTAKAKATAASKSQKLDSFFGAGK